MCKGGVRSLGSQAVVCLVAASLILAVGGAWTPSAQAQGRELLTPIQQPERQLAAAQQKFLTKLRASKGLSFVKVARLDASLLGQENVDLDLAPGVRLRSAKGVVTRKDARTSIWSIPLSGRDAKALLVVHDQNVTGTISTDKGVFQVRPLGGGAHAVVQIDPNRLPADHPAEYLQLERRAVKPPDLAATKDVTHDAVPTIRVLVGYTPAVSAAVADVEGLIETAIVESNQSYQNSQISARLVLVHQYQVTYTESGSYDTDLALFRGKTDGSMDEVHDRRRRHCADVCVLLIDNTDYCGLASAIMADASTAFAAVHYDCATGNYSFGHEIGHLLGARHNPEADPTNTPFSYGHGYLHGPQFRTVMAYNCPGGCPRRDYWSNPNVSLMGFPTGTAATHDNARVLNATAPTGAGFVSTLPCMRIDWGKYKFLTALCKVLGCGATLRTGEELVNPVPELLRVQQKGGATAAKLASLREQAAQLFLRAEQATPAQQTAIEKQAQALEGQVNQLLRAR